jgi:hypothetical protein
MPCHLVGPTIERLAHESDTRAIVEYGYPTACSTPPIRPTPSGPCSSRSCNLRRPPDVRACTRGGPSSTRTFSSYARAVPGASCRRSGQHGRRSKWTNHKFCWTRWSALSFTGPRSHPLPRAWLPNDGKRQLRCLVTCQRPTSQPLSLCSIRYSTVPDDEYQRSSQTRLNRNDISIETVRTGGRT